MSHKIYSQLKQMLLRRLSFVFLCLSLALNVQGQTFSRAVTYSAGALPVIIAFADFNGDGKPDIATLSKQGVPSVALLLNKGDGTFLPAQTFQADGYPDGLAVADFNGDGKPDLIIGKIDFTGGTNHLRVYLGNGDGTFQPQASFAVAASISQICVGDFNGDGKTDLALAQLGQKGVSLLLGIGDGTFRQQVDYSVNSATTALAIGDFNGDGKLDVALGTGSGVLGDGGVAILLGNGEGTLQPPVNYAVAQTPFSLVTGDLNGDGRLDIVTLSRTEQSGVSILLGNGDGTFRRAPDLSTDLWPPNSVAVGDFDVDGKADLALLDQYGMNLYVLRGNGDGTFQLPVYAPINLGFIAVAAADLNGDGRPDVVAVSGGQWGGATVLINKSGPYSVSGVVTDSTGAPLGGVPIIITGGEPLTGSTDSIGRYSFSGLTAGGSFTVTPTQRDPLTFLARNEYFLPPSRSFSPISSNVTADFTNVLTMGFVTSNFSASEGAGSALITVYRTGYVNSQSTVDYSTSDGTASQKNKYIPTSGTLTFAPGERSKTFSVLLIDEAYAEGNQTVNLTLSNPSGAILDAPSTATLTIYDNDQTPSASNPLDDPQFFAREQYLDFLNRVPEAQGLADWTTYMKTCAATDYQCQVDRRVTASSGFFRSPEFFSTGYFVMRMYRATLYPRPATGAPLRPTYDEFLRDAPSVHYGVSGDTLAASKLAFAQNWVQRADFLAQYPASLATGEFVDKLAQAAQVTLTTAQRNQMLTETRAQIVIDIVDSPQVDQHEYNPAFVTMQYMAYLRRQPEDKGYTDWLGYLNQNPSGCGVMIYGFAFSREYRERFGPYGDASKFPGVSANVTDCGH